jgi:hypothetical protein
MNKVQVCVSGAEVCTTPEQRGNACAAQSSARRLGMLRSLAADAEYNVDIVVFEASGNAAEDEAKLSTLNQVLEQTGGTGGSGGGTGGTSTLSLAAVVQTVTSRVSTAVTEATQPSSGSGTSLLTQNLQTAAADAGVQQLTTVTTIITKAPETQVGDVSQPSPSPAVGGGGSGEGGVGGAIGAVAAVAAVGSAVAFWVIRKRKLTQARLASADDDVGATAAGVVDLNVSGESATTATAVPIITE